MNASTETDSTVPNVSNFEPTDEPEGIKKSRISIRDSLSNNLCSEGTADYLRGDVAKKIASTLNDESRFKAFLAKIFGVNDSTNIYDGIRRYFDFARRHIADLFDEIEGGNELHGSYHNLNFNPDQSLTPYDYAQYALKKLPKELYRYMQLDSKPGQTRTLRSISELYIIFYIALKYRDYLHTPQAGIMKERKSVDFVIDSLIGDIIDAPKNINIDPLMDNPFFDLTHTVSKYWIWDDKEKRYIITPGTKDHDTITQRIGTDEKFQKFDMDSITLDIGEGKHIPIAHICMRDKDPWSLIKKSIRKGTAENSHTDYTGIKLVLTDETPNIEKTTLDLYQYFLDKLGDGISWIEKPALEELRGALKNRKDMLVYKGILKTVIDGISYPIEIQICNESAYILRDMDPKSPIHHAAYKRKQLNEVIGVLLPEELYGKPNVNNPHEVRELI